MSRHRSLTVITVTCVGLVVSSAARASASFTDVWFPYGNVNYNIDPAMSVARTTIVDTMTYMSEHTPLDIAEEPSEAAANLHFRHNSLVGNFAGSTPGYWIQGTADDNQTILFDANYPPGRSTVAHEFGHALGRAHEFQRDDRDNHVSVCFNVDPFNYSKLGSAYWPDPYYNLSPYDYASIMNLGYDSCVTPLAGSNEQTRDYEGWTNLLSVHDINGIYRMYGEELGVNNEGDRFGVAVSSGDYDDDGFKDIVVANLQDEGLWLSFFRGVFTDDSEDVVGLKFMPWFKVLHDGSVSADASVTLATGDFNGDGIDDLALGQPDYDGERGRVSILFVNSLRTDPDKDSFQEAFAPWGRKGIQYRIDLAPVDVGLHLGEKYVVRHRFGASLAALRGTNYRDDDEDVIFHDLAIGAPGAKLSVGAVAKGAAVVVKGRRDTSPKDFSVATYTTVWNPSNTAGEFGAAVSALPGLCALTGSTARYRADFLAVGAPGHDADKGAVHAYGCLTTGTASALSNPPLLSSHYATATGGRYGSALAGFRVRVDNTRTTYLAVGQPNYVATDGKVVGRVALDQFTTSGVRTFLAAMVPSEHAGADEFGHALAVQQRPFSDTDNEEGGLDSYIAIGMPGAKVDGVRVGSVRVWRPLNSNGTLQTGSLSIIEPNGPVGADLHFGESVAALRPLVDKGGFVVGAPDGLVYEMTPGPFGSVIPETGPRAGFVSAYQNDGDPFNWNPILRHLEQESVGDKRPSNR